MRWSGSWLLARWNGCQNSALTNNGTSINTSNFQSSFSVFHLSSVPYDAYTVLYLGGGCPAFLRLSSEGKLSLWKNPMSGACPVDQARRIQFRSHRHLLHLRNPYSSTHSPNYSRTTLSHQRRAWIIPLALYRYPSGESLRSPKE